jgi:TetR/AcrR family transcriptional regulator, copper-responsive repressor
MGRPKGFERADVLESAIQVFWKKGYADTSIQDLEKATGVNKSGLYSEFNDKQDLFMACLEYYISQAKGLEVLSEEPLGWKNIETLLQASQTCKGKKGCFAVNTFREMPILPPKAKTLLMENLEQMKAAIAKNLEAENVSAPSTVADIILTFNSGNCLAQNVESASSLERVTAFLNLLQQQKNSSAHSTSW